MTEYAELKNSYTAGFNTDIESTDFEPGLSEDTILRLSALKNEPEWVTEFRLDAYRHLQKIEVPTATLSAGLYFINVNVDGISKTLRLNVAH